MTNKKSQRSTAVDPRAVAVIPSEAGPTDPHVPARRRNRPVSDRIRMAVALCALLCPIAACAPQTNFVLGPSDTAFVIGPQLGRVRFDFATTHSLRPSSNFWIGDGDQMKVVWGSYGMDYTVDPAMPCAFPETGGEFQNTATCQRCDYCNEPPGDRCGPLLAPRELTLIPKLLAFPNFLADGTREELEIPGLGSGCSRNGGFDFTPSHNATYRLLEPNFGGDNEKELVSAQVLVVKAGMAQEVMYELETNVGLEFLDVEDLKDSGRLAVALRNRSLRSVNDRVSAYIFDRLSVTTRELLARYRDRRGRTGPHPAASDALKRALVLDLNELMRNGSLFEEQRFARVPLTEETRDLIARRPRGPDLVRLNRLLIEDTYPGSIARIRLWFRGTMPGDPILDNFSPTLLATKARILIGDRGTNPATGRLEISNPEVLRPSRLIFIVDYNEDASISSNDNVRCYGDVRTAQGDEFDLRNCRARESDTTGSPLNMTPAYLRDQPSERLTWIAEFDSERGARRPVVAGRTAAIAFSVE